MKEVTDKSFKLMVLNNGVWKINVPDTSTYRTLTMKIYADKLQWYTYEGKTERPFKVIVGGPQEEDYRCSSSLRCSKLLRG